MEHTKIVPADSEKMSFMALNLSKENWDEINLLYDTKEKDWDIQKCLQDLYVSSDKSYILLHKGAPVVAFGYIVSGYYKDRGDFWFVHTDVFSNTLFLRLLVLRRSKKYLKIMFEKVAILDCLLYSENDKIQEWAAYRGFTSCDTFYIRNAKFIQYRLAKGDL